MSSFTKELIVIFLKDGQHYQCVEEFEYYRENDHNDIITVPKGFITDLASVPRIFWNIIPPSGTYTKPAVLHDYLYSTLCDRNYSRKEADDIFLEAMKAVGVKKFIRGLLYYCVRWFAGSRYRTSE